MKTLTNLFYVCLVSVNLCCIISISANELLSTSELCAKNHKQFCGHCKQFIYTNHNKPRQYIELSSNNTTDLLFEFYVIGSSSCEVHLSPVVNPNLNTSGVYQFLIQNKQILVRHVKLLGSKKTENSLLSERQPVQFRIKISPSGFIQIYRNDEKLMATVDRNPASDRFTFNYYYFTFTTDHPNRMNFYYDCAIDNHTSSAQKTTSHVKMFALLSIILLLGGR
ncbi:uncharacterized protein LOC116338736 [Contarinia nasturtii]|uniref:uncharacterized protein LOC116338736 n=1 Tax=Contarinia nasturtii TaxID=265458 RepID=UPI0012D3B5B8|nr:uncharacterized protein LOC116338736 [Contarinia nasturtii]